MCAEKLFFLFFFFSFILMILKSLFKTRNEVEEGYLNFHVFSHLGELNISRKQRDWNFNVLINQQAISKEKIHQNQHFYQKKREIDVESRNQHFYHKKRDNHTQKVILVCYTLLHTTKLLLHMENGITGMIRIQFQGLEGEGVHLANKLLNHVSAVGINSLRERDQSKK